MSSSGGRKGRDQSEEESDDDNEDDDLSDDDDDEEAEEEEKGVELKETTPPPLSSNSVEKKLTKAEKLAAFNSIIGTTDETPQWLSEGEKEAKKKRLARKAGKKKKLTDDWRFWLAIIAAAGFGSAFFSVYQQTGGFGFGGAADGIFGGSGGEVGSSGELII